MSFRRYIFRSGALRFRHSSLFLATVALAFSIASSHAADGVGGDLVLATAVSNFEFSSGALTAGSYDLVNGLTSTAHLGGILNLAFSSTETYADGSVRILDFAGYTGDFEAVKVTGLNAGQNAIFNPLNGTVNIQSIPEPGCLSVACLFGTMTLLRRRRA